MSVLTNLSDNETAADALDVFSIYPNQVAIQKQILQDTRPVSQYGGGEAPLEFETNLQGDIYTDLKNTRLFLKIRILSSDGTPLSEERKITPVDLFFHAMFKKVDVYLNRTLVSTSGDLYPYKAMLNRLLRVDSVSSKKSKYLQGEMFYDQDTGAPSETSPGGGNLGLYVRHQMTKGSKIFDLVGFPMNDCLELDRYLINGCHLRIVLHRNSPDFCLVSGEDGDQPGAYQVRIEDAFLRLRKMKVNAAILVAHAKLLKNVSAKYPFVKTETKVATIARGQSVFLWDHINSAYVPRLIVLTFVDSSAVLGSLKKNPFNFESLNLRQLNVTVDGVPVPGAPVNVNYGENLTLEVLERLLGYPRSKHVTNPMGGVGARDRSNIDIDRTALSKGRALYVFDIAASLDDSFKFELLHSGTLSVEANFATPLEKNVACVVYCEYDSFFEVDESRVVKLT